jgi:Domain of unknown function (DUF397)
VEKTIFKSQPGNPGSCPYRAKRSLSFFNGNCIEMASPLDSGIGIHNSPDHRSLIFPFTGDEWHTFLKGARNGEFDSFGLADDSTPGWEVEVADYECVRPYSTSSASTASSMHLGGRRDK